jgi:hypothetical protein
MTITTDFCGGNALILELGEHTVCFRPELRDTTTAWFYWSFAVEGAAGKTLEFRITDCSPKEWIGPYGAAVSHDLIHWDWSGADGCNGDSFCYTFAENEDRVYFAHDMLYHPSHFHRFCEQRDIQIRNIAEDRRGTPIPHIKVGNGENVILLTARHHSCEAPGNYVLEGIIDEFLDMPMSDWSIEAIPFVDADGVVYGDQGKNRAPHDHYTDYLEELYPGVRAVKSVMMTKNVQAFFDLHAPWHFIDPVHPTDAHAFLVLTSPGKMDAYSRFSRLFFEECTAEGLIFEPEENKPPGVGWNRHDTPVTSDTWFNAYHSAPLTLVLETSYFGDDTHIVSQNRLTMTGRSFMRAVKRFFEGT